MTDSVLSNQACWKSCQFGATSAYAFGCPFEIGGNLRFEVNWLDNVLSVVYSQSESILVNKAPASSSDVVVFNGIGPNETISGMDQNPLHTFEIALATSERTVIIDTRYKKYPLLHWGPQHTSRNPIPYQLPIEPLQSLV
ncbi:hypothetical protein BASA60_001887 [Batrachochytrium salamandrivorans]|nr:hypothetical protein BASA60_001887 [Batrachochytrium salamandrivorans]